MARKKGKTFKKRPIGTASPSPKHKRKKASINSSRKKSKKQQYTEENLQEALAVLSR